jgi:hypothetical protein
MKVTVEMSENEIQDILKYSGERMKGPAIRRLAIDALNYRKRLEMNAKFRSGEWAAELPSLDQIRKARLPWDR